MSGGLLITAGSLGMAQAPSEDSEQNSVMMTFSEIQEAGTLVHLEDSKGNTIADFKPAKNFQSIPISSPELAKDTSYTLYTGGTVTGKETNCLFKDGSYKDGTKIVEFSLSNTVTWLNESGVTESRSVMPGGGRMHGR